MLADAEGQPPFSAVYSDTPHPPQALLAKKRVSKDMCTHGDRLVTFSECLSYFQIIHPVFNSFGLESLLSTSTDRLPLGAGCISYMPPTLTACFVSSPLHFSLLLQLLILQGRKPDHTNAQRNPVSGKGRGGWGWKEHSHEWNPEVKHLHTMLGKKAKTRNTKVWIPRVIIY